MPLPERTFAVAIRDGAQLFLWIRISRSKNGDVYCVLPTAAQGVPEHRDWNPHASHHASGKTHYKSFGKIRRQRQQQKPGANLKGTQHLLTTDIRSDDLSQCGVICNPEEFRDLIEVPIALIRPNNARETHVSVDLIEAGGRADLAPGCEILVQREFSGVPPILVTVWSNPR
jgi:hypothetical protein